MNRVIHKTILILFLFFLAAVIAADKTHVLVKGDTLYSLSRAYQIALPILIERNSIKDPSKVAVGQKIVIPETYTVQKGDTLYGIARKRSISVKDLQKANNLTAKAILKTGSVLLLPETSHTTVLPKAKDIHSTPAPVTAASLPQHWKDPREYAKKAVDKNIVWPVPALSVSYLAGKLYGVVIDSEKQAPVQSLTAGKILSKGTHHGYGHVVFVQSNTKHVYVYGGLTKNIPAIGTELFAGQKIGSLAPDVYSGIPRLYFMVYKNSIPIDPAKAPRER